MKFSYKYELFSASCFLQGISGPASHEVVGLIRKGKGCGSLGTELLSPDRMPPPLVSFKQCELRAELPGSKFSVEHLGGQVYFALVVH